MENKNIEITKDILVTGKVLVSAIKAQLNGEKYEFPDDTDYSKLYKLSERHKVTPLVAPSVTASEKAPEEIRNVFKKELFRSAARHAAQQKEADELAGIFAQNEIKHCFLKGAKISRYYDEPDMRFMLDMDVYIEPGKAVKAAQILENRGYKYDNYEDAKDAGYVKKPFLNFELHKELKYDYDKGYEYYKGAFERMVTDSNGYTMNMTDEDFYVYVLSHTAHHFESAGTGIKSIVDHYYLKKKLKPLCNADILEKALNDTGLTEFSNSMDNLSDFWFGDGCVNENVRETAEYVILSGVFGSQTNYYLSGIIKGDYTEKKSSYFLTRLFLPFYLMKKRYPILKKAPFLLPIMWVVRWISAIKGTKKYADEAKTIGSVDEDAKNRQIEFLKRNGL
ncbi:MAG: nucleotidyltransferase family protein [Clostridia bacterium]|nr:nucleotidyltransferase family protein [Clostridia bacterium]